MKKNKLNGGRIAIIAILLVLVLLVGGMYVKLVELTSQIAYLQDTTNIILADVGGVESTITQTLQEESGMVEHYSIKLKDLDFASDTYGVSVYMIPKEYTDKTTVSIFFGTIECPLQKDGYAYTGEITLPLEKSFDGNLTFLFANGKKRNTEVYSNYDGMKLYLDEVLSGRTEAKPKYEDGILSLSGTVEFSLTGKNRYEFERFEMVAEYNEREVWKEDVRKAKAAGNGSQREPVSVVSETEAAVSTATMSPFNEMSGNAALVLDYEPTEEGRLRVYLRAVTTEGYRFEYDLLHASLVESEEEDSGEAEGEESGQSHLKLDEESLDTDAFYSVYDNKGGKRILQ